MRADAGLDSVSSATLRTLAAAIRSGQLTSPYSTFALGHIAPLPGTFVAALHALDRDEIAPRHLAMLLDAKADARQVEMEERSSCELVWTGPDQETSRARDTAVVLDELFANATRSVLVSSSVVHQGRRVFATLSQRMIDHPALDVRLFLHVGREQQDARLQSEILREFAAHLVEEWPGERRPATFYDPRSLSEDRSLRAAWHAKCVLVDDEVGLVTSANFTEWAQSRNVEAGVLVRNPSFVQQLRQQFEGLVRSKQVSQLPGF